MLQRGSGKKVKAAVVAEHLSFHFSRPCLVPTQNFFINSIEFLDTCMEH